VVAILHAHFIGYDKTPIQEYQQNRGRHCGSTDFDELPSGLSVRVEDSRVKLAEVQSRLAGTVKLAACPT
jgi:hypothetical protein